MAVGSRSQSARTYLEKHLEEFLDCDTDELIKHGLRALRDTLPNEVELNTKVMSSSSLYSFLCKIKFEELIYLILSLFTYSDHQIMVSIWPVQTPYILSFKSHVHFQLLLSLYWVFHFINLNILWQCLGLSSDPLNMFESTTVISVMINEDVSKFFSIHVWNKIEGYLWRLTY